MTDATVLDLTTGAGRLVVHRWAPSAPTFVVLLAHGISEHAGRYQHVADHLLGLGAAVYAPDHHGHGKSDGDRAIINDVGDLVADLRTVADRAVAEHPGLPVVALGHSLGGIIVTRYAQQYGSSLAAVVLSAPVIGGNPAFEALLNLDPFPEVPLDPDMLSRDPEVGKAYLDDPLVYSGPLPKITLEAIFAEVDRIAAGPNLGSLPVLWLHGTEDQLAPLGSTTQAIERTGGQHVESKIYPGAHHEVFNETNADEILADVTTFLKRVLA